METVRSKDTVLPHGLLFGAFEKQGDTCKRRNRCVGAHGRYCTHYVHTVQMLLDAAGKCEQARASVTNGNSNAYPRCRDAISANWPPQIPQPKLHLEPLVSMYQPHTGSARWSSDMSAISRCRVAHEPARHIEGTEAHMEHMGRFTERGRERGWFRYMLASISMLYSEAQKNKVEGVAQRLAHGLPYRRLNSDGIEKTSKSTQRSRQNCGRVAMESAVEMCFLRRRLLLRAFGVAHSTVPWPSYILGG